MTAAVEKTAEELRKEIEELHRQQWEITERLRDPRGIRRGGLAANGLRGNGPRQRGLVRPAERVDAEVLPPAKKRLSSAVVKVEDGEVVEDARTEVKDQVFPAEGGTPAAGENERKGSNFLRGGFRRDGNQRTFRRADAELPIPENVPRILPKDEDPSLVKRNQRMLGQLLGTLEKFRQEDKNLATSEAYMRRSDSLKRAEQRAREESERLRQQEREQLAEKRKRDLTLRARVAAKAEEKKLELLFLQWSEHQKRLCNFLRTKTRPAIFYLPVKPLEEEATLIEQHKEQAFQEWRTARREELSEYQKQIGEQYIANVEAEFERWQNARNARRSNKLSLQETMDEDLENHRLEHGPKTRKIPGKTEEEEDVEDIGGEDDMIDDVLGIDESNRRVDDAEKPATGDSNPAPEEEGMQ